MTTHCERDILCSLLEKGWKDLWASVEEMVVEDVLAKIKIVNILTQMANIVHSEKLLYDFLFTAPRNIKIPDEKASWKSFQNRTYSSLQSIVDEGINSGDFKKNTNPELFMKAVGGMFHGIVFMGDQKKIDRKDIERLISSFII